MLHANANSAAPRQSLIRGHHRTRLNGLAITMDRPPKQTKRRCAHEPLLLLAHRNL